jgi:patatin-like phospholipase/acyl hydrolase
LERLVSLLPADFVEDGNRTESLLIPMATSSEPTNDGPRLLRLLSLDGGGVRGLSSIMILRALMTGLNRGRSAPTQPWQEFDLIAGTSTGGLLAIMLGRLRMSVEDCEDAYAQLSDAIFTPRRNRANIPGRALDFLKANGKFDERPLEEILKRKIADAGLDADELLEDARPDSCKV